jgi:hypothetical protein
MIWGTWGLDGAATPLGVYRGPLDDGHFSHSADSVTAALGNRQLLGPTLLLSGRRNIR